MQAFRFKNLQGAYKLSRGIHHERKVMQSLHAVPGPTAKRLINCVGTRLREIDPQRWEGVPVTFKTHFRDEGGYTDIHTCIHIHDALEREFGFDIKDKKILVSDIETAFYVVINGHDTV